MVETREVCVEVEFSVLCAKRGCCSVASMIELVGIDFDREYIFYVTVTIMFQLATRCLVSAKAMD